MDIFNDSLSSTEKTIYCERYINDGSPSGFTFINTTSVGTRAYDKVSSIKVPIIEFNSNKKFSYFGDSITIIDDNQLIIHPDMLHNIYDHTNIKNIQYVEAIPLASNRTVFIPQFNKYIKLQYNGLIGRIERYITCTHIRHSMSVNTIFRGLNWDNTPFHFFPEVHGRIYNQNIGMIVRNADIIPKFNGVIVPAFSLFSVDKNAPNDDSILLQLISRTSMDKDEFVLSKFILPAISLYFKILLETGLQIEAHSQNICYIISDFNIEIAIRDFESIDKDLEIAPKYNNLFNPKYKCIDKTSQDYAKRHSFMFDFKLGEYLITPILVEAGKAGCNINLLVERVKQSVNNYMSLLPDDFFPHDHWYSFPNQLIDRTSAGRPYKENCSPKYR